MWRNTDQVWLTTTNFFSDLGNLIQTTDPGNHTTTFSYPDNFSDGVDRNTQAYLTTTTYPTVGGISHVEHKKYYHATGSIHQTTDRNGQVTTFTYDTMNRQNVTNFPDGGQIDLDYDDTNRIVTTKRKRDPSNFIFTRAHGDQFGRPSRTETCEDGSPACTPSIKTDTSYDPLGRKETVSNPYRTAGDMTYGITKFKYDAFGRVTRVIPADGNEAVDTNVIKTAYSGNVTAVTDQTDKQRRSFTDVLGQLTHVNEPTGGSPATPSAGSATVNSATGGGVQVHNISAVQATASVTIGSANPSGAVQSVQEQTGPATQSTGSATVSGSLQSTQVQTQAGTAGTGSVAISGFTRSVIDYDNCSGPRRTDCPVIYDNGGVSITVNGFTATSPYGQGWTAASIASTLANVFNTNSGSPVTATVSNTTVYLTAKTTGVATNYSLSATSWSNDPATFPILSYTATPSGATLTGGQNAQYTTVHDSGTVEVTVNQGQPNAVTVEANFGQGSTVASVAASLRSALHATSFVHAGGTGATITLTSETSGSGTNYPLAASWTYNSSQFSSPSFTASTSGMSGGANAQYTTTYDSGTVTITVNGQIKSVTYGQGSTKTSVAAALAALIHNDGAYPADAEANGATVSLTARTPGTAGNSYTLSASTTYNTVFSQASFPPSTSGGTLTGGVNGQTIHDSGTVTLTIAGCTPLTVNYQNGSTGGTVADSLRTAVNNSSCPVSASGSGMQVVVQSDNSGSGTNYALSSSATTDYPQHFTSGPSFTLSTAGMSGGSDGNPGSLATPAATRYTYDVLGNLVCVWQKGTDTSAEPTDPANNCLSAPPAWRPRKFTYNSLSQLLTAINPESGTITYTYDNEGNLLTKTDARGIATTHAYDELHRLTQKSFNDGNSPIQSVTYDANTDGSWQTNLVGRASRSCWEGTSTNCDYLGYDEMGRTIRHKQGGGLWGVIDSDYDLAGLRTALRYNESYTGKDRWIAYDYDPAGRVRTVRETTGAQKVYADSIQYHPHGPWSAMTLSNGALQQAATYNSRLQPTTKTVTKVGPSSTVMDFSFVFTNAQGRNNGNLVSMWDNVQVLNYGFQYDELNRLQRAETVNSSAWGNTYAYDSWGNLHTKAQVPGKQNGEFLQQTATTQNRFAGWSYDNAGNLLNDGAHNYQYDPDGRIRCMDAGANCSNPAAVYVYSAEGRRVKRTVSGLTMLYLHNNTAVISEFSNPSPTAGTWLKDYVYLNGELLATESAANGTRFHFSDHLGTPRVITNADATWTNRHDYYPYGKEITASADGETHKFTGKERDSESELDYFGARYLGSGIGRFVSPDSVSFSKRPDPQTWNLYSYVRNVPIVHVDPDGHDWYFYNKGWHWHRGNKPVTYVDPTGRRRTATSLGTHLLVVRRTGTNPQTGSTTYSLTLYNQNKVQETGQAFSGGGGPVDGQQHPAIGSGNYLIRGDIRDPQGPTTINTDPRATLRGNPPPFYGIQEIREEPIPDPSNPGIAWDVYGAWGPRRAYLNPILGTTERGNYLHGQSNGYGYTHGCLCYGSDSRIIDYILRLPPQRVPVAVDVPVEAPK